MKSGFPSQSVFAGLIAGGLILAVLSLAPPAQAGGIGGSLSYSRGHASLEDTDNVWSDLDVQSDMAGFGLVFDTNLAQDRLFNYRLNASIQFTDQEVQQSGLENQVQGTSFAFDQTFGFGIIRTPEVRVFVGPSLHLGVGRTDDDYFVDGFQANYDQTTFSAGIGPELGVNFNVGRHLTLSLSSFARYGVQVQSFDDFFDEAGSDGNFAGGEFRAGIVSSIFFRFGPDEGEADPYERPRRRDWDRY